MLISPFYGPKTRKEQKVLLTIFSINIVFLVIIVALCLPILKAFGQATKPQPSMLLPALTLFIVAIVDSFLLSRIRTGRRLGVQQSIQNKQELLRFVSEMKSKSDK